MFPNVIICISIVAILAAADPIIELPNGKIRGREATTYAKTPYYSFQKIPYAAPPVGPLRFQAPQPAPKWDDVLNATTLDVTCYQNPTKSTDSEDCLVINVYTPQLPGDNSLLPVMFFIHGGAFKKDSSKEALPHLFVDNGVILVAGNYRLGAFGFLSTQDEVISGNNGLKDQLLAIQWTHDNIHLFGGDPAKVTIFGESAGSASVGYQLLNQNSEGLFWGAILESGTCLSPWSLQKSARSVAFGVGSILNEDFGTQNNSVALLNFLQSVDASDLQAAAIKYSQKVEPAWQFDISVGHTYAPVIEVKSADAFLTKKMYGLLKAGNILKVPTMLGINSEESLLFNKDANVLQTILTTFDADLDLIVPDDMQITDSEEHAKMAVSIRNIYTDGEPFGTNLGAFIRHSSDTRFGRSMTKHAEIYSQLAPTYFYQFSYDGKLGNLDVHYDGADSVGHSEQANYMFCEGDACSLDNYPESDKLTSQRIIKLWTNFAKYQNPTPEESELFENVTWPQLDVTGGDFLYLDINETLGVRNHPKKEPLAKWETLYDGLGYNDFDTY